MSPTNRPVFETLAFNLVIPRHLNEPDCLEPVRRLSLLTSDNSGMCFVFYETATTFETSRRLKNPDFRWHGKMADFSLYARKALWVTRINRYAYTLLLRVLDALHAQYRFAVKN